MRDNRSDLKDSLLRFMAINAYQKDTPLPSIRDLAERFHAKPYQVNSVMRLLEQAGNIRKTPHKGYFAACTPPAGAYDTNINRLLFIMPDQNPLLTRYYTRLAAIYNLKTEMAVTGQSVILERQLLVQNLDNINTAVIFIRAQSTANTDLISRALDAGRKWLFTVGVPPYSRIVPYIGTDDYMIGAYAARLLAACPKSAHNLYIGYDPHNNPMSASRRDGVRRKLALCPGQEYEELLFTSRLDDNARVLRSFLAGKRKKRCKIFTSSMYFTSLFLKALPDWEVGSDYFLVGMDYQERVQGHPITGVYRSKELEAKLAMDWILKPASAFQTTQIFLKPVVKIGNTIELE